MSNISPKTIIKFDQLVRQQDQPICRMLGFVEVQHLLSLFDNLTLDANPRASKVGTVTNDIQESVREDPALFQFKTKGVLLGTSSYRSLERKRFELEFLQPAYEGLLDGGHNMLALGIHLLSSVAPAKELKKVKYWSDFKDLWDKYRDAVKTEVKKERQDIFDGNLQPEQGRFTFKVPVELLVPTDIDDDDVVERFKLALTDICAARNNNAQLTTEARANQRGFYEDIEERMPAALSPRVEWKTNEWGSNDTRPVKVRDLLALSWVPLTVLAEQGLLPDETEAGTKLNFAVHPPKIYGGKGDLSKLFDALMEHPDVSKPTDGPRHELHHVGVGSAFDTLAILPRLYDNIFLGIGAAYNRAGGSFGNLRQVKIPKRTKPLSPFYREEGSHVVPDGYIVPIIYGLKSLLEVRDGKVRWSRDPVKFLDKHLDSLVKAFKMPMEMAGFDPQKIAKNETSYTFMVGEVEKAMLKDASAKAGVVA